MHELRQVLGTRGPGPGAMLLLLDSHSFDDRAAPGVGRRQAVEMSFEVFGYLAFRFLDKPERPTVTKRTAGDANGKRTCIPEWSEPARHRAEFFEALFAPAQVIEFFRGRFAHVIGDRLASRDCRVTLVQPLGRHFTRMVDAHEAGRVPSLMRRQL